MDPTFEEVWNLLQQMGPAVVQSSGAEYRVQADYVNGDPDIIAYPQEGRVVIHSDCWGHDVTCQGTWAGQLYQGPSSLLDWYAQHLVAPPQA